MNPANEKFKLFNLSSAIDCGCIIYCVKNAFKLIPCIVPIKITNVIKIKKPIKEYFIGFNSLLIIE